MSGLALRPRHARIQMGERGSGGALLKYHKNIVSLAIGPTPKNHKATFYVWLISAL